MTHNLNIRPKPDSASGWEYFLVVKRPCGEVIRERRNIPATHANKAAREQYAKARFDHLYEHGKNAPAPTAGSAKLTVRVLCERWMAATDPTMPRSEQKLRKQRLTDYVFDTTLALPTGEVVVFGDLDATEVRSRHCVALLGYLKQVISPATNKVLTERSQGKIFKLLRSAFTWAVRNELIVANPIDVDQKVLPRNQDADPNRKATAVFALWEVELLVTDPRVPWCRRVAYAIEFFTGLRCGEGSALRFRNIDFAEGPLGRITCTESYKTKERVIGPNKTKVERHLPIHPDLAKMLREWWRTGWAATFGRAPTKDDLIVPSTTRCGVYEGRLGMSPRRNDTALKNLRADLATLGLENMKRRHHDTRRSFVSLGLSAGANQSAVKHMTHPSPTEAFGLYTTPTWEERCNAVLKLQLGAAQRARATDDIFTPPQEVRTHAVSENRAVSAVVESDRKHLRGHDRRTLG